MKIILMDPNFVRTFFVNIFFLILIFCTLENKYFLVRTKLGYLRYGSSSEKVRLTVLTQSKHET